MAQTGTPAAAARGCNREDLDPSPRKRQCRDTHYKRSKEPPIQGKGRTRTAEEMRDPDSKPSSNRQQISRLAVPETLENHAADNFNPNNPIDFWRREGRWPRQYFDSDLEHLLARKRSLSILSGRKRSNSASSATPSDQKPREEKSAPYRDPRYETLLQTKGTWMETSEIGIIEKCKQTCRDLLGGAQPSPEGTIFDDLVFERACKNIQNKNEVRVIQDFSRLIVPSAETLALYKQNKHLSILTESVNEGWNNSIPLTGTRPQPDYSVGLRRDAFTGEQHAKMSPFIGDFIAGDLSYFMATYYMYFPFFTCEVKCGAAALDIADRQNAHSMTLAVRGIVELFRLVGREKEVHRQILAFSISHDHRSVRIYGYYPVINEKETKYYRHPIHTFDFTALDGKEKWTAYRFTKNIYDTWVPYHFEGICSAIDQLPSTVNFNVPTLSESASLSQGLGNPSRSGADSASSHNDDQSNNGEQIATPSTSFSKTTPAKRRKKPVKK